MTISGNVSDGDWSVAATTHRTAGGFNCSIQFSHHTPEGIFKHEFIHSNVFPTEREAVLGGLREGMEWVRLKMSNTFSIQPHESAVGPE
ncbi:UDP-glucose 4-epimerase (plasmid) [Paraburkholderia phytofirmans OLGA172]|uniref:UDP-glucose 4-epimerase n=1 Tax=Paraburkholderia phytofirmans OLGA172 TaxID=1417228 RepID=A0A160FWP9_9BURK|nr:hypothetical protein [Paraburkholderia phytofirmans]ANB77859.1 UDP-glucose 4-epimerase [Paraburkholderia phytofirmans OLGA172]